MRPLPQKGTAFVTLFNLGRPRPEYFLADRRRCRAVVLQDRRRLVSLRGFMFAQNPTKGRMHGLSGVVNLLLLEPPRVRRGVLWRVPLSVVGHRLDRLAASQLALPPTAYRRSCVERVGLL